MYNLVGDAFIDPELNQNKSDDKKSAITICAIAPCSFISFIMERILLNGGILYVEEVTYYIQDKIIH